jgi:putative oxidoreductase
MQRVVAALAAQSKLGYALVRAFTAVVLFSHGYQKVFHQGLNAVAASFNELGIFLPRITGPFIGLLELVGGGLLFLGLFTRWLGVLFAIEFTVAAYVEWVLQNRGFFGSLLELYLLVTALLLATNGAGRYSLDALFRRFDA